MLWYLACANRINHNAKVIKTFGMHKYLGAFLILYLNHLVITAEKSTFASHYDKARTRFYDSNAQTIRVIVIKVDYKD